MDRHSELEDAVTFTLAKEGISLDKEDINLLRCVDEASGEIFAENDVKNMDPEDVFKLFNEVMNTTVSVAIRHILDKYDLPHIYGYVIAQGHVDRVLGPTKKNIN